MAVASLRPSPPTHRHTHVPAHHPPTRSPPDLPPTHTSRHASTHSPNTSSQSHPPQNPQIRYNNLGTLTRPVNKKTKVLQSLFLDRNARVVLEDAEAIAIDFVRHDIGTKELNRPLSLGTRDSGWRLEPTAYISWTMRVQGAHKQGAGQGTFPVGAQPRQGFATPPPPMIPWPRPRAWCDWCWSAPRPQFPPRRKIHHYHAAPAGIPEGPSPPPPSGYDSGYIRERI